MEKVVYIEFLKEQEEKLTAIVEIDMSWPPKSFKKDVGLMVCKSKTTDEKIKELETAGFKVHLDK
jgi:hypothetical protein